MTQTLTAMEKAVSEGGDSLEQFAKVSGVSSQEFVDHWNKDPIQAIQEFIKGLGKLDDQGESATLMLDEMGLSGVRQSNMLKSLALASDTLTGAVDMSTQAWGENNALTEEAGKRYETDASKLQVYMNKINDLAISMGAELAPAVFDLLQSLEPLVGTVKDGIQWFTNLDDSTKKNIVGFTAMTIAAGPLINVTGTLIKTFGGASKVLGLFGMGIGKSEVSLRTLLGSASAGTGVMAKLGGLFGTTATGATTLASGASTATGALTTSTASVGALGGALSGLLPVLGIAGAAIAAAFATKAIIDHKQSVDEWGADVDSQTRKALESFQNYSGNLELYLGNSSTAVKNHKADIENTFGDLVDVVSDQVKKSNDEIDEHLGKLPENIRQSLEEGLQAEKDKNSEREANAKLLQDNINQIMQKASDERRELTDQETYYIKTSQEQIAKDLADTVGGDTKKIFENLTADLDTLDKKSIITRIDNARKMVQDLNKTYKDNQKNIQEMYDQGLINGTEYHDAMNKLDDDYQESLNESLAAYHKLMEAGGYSESAMKANIEAMGGDYEKLMKYMRQVENRVAQMHGILVEGSGKAGEWAVSANEKWNELAKDPATGLVRENIQSVVKAAKESEKTWNNLEFAVKYGELDTNTKQQIMVASIAEGTWNDLSFGTQQALIMDNFGYFGKELLVASGKWDGLDLAVKDAILNTNSSETLQKALQDAGLWDQMSFEEHMAIIATNADKMIIEAMQANGTWDGLSYEQKEAVLNSNVSQAQIDFLNTNDLWNNQEFMEKVADIMTNSPEKEKDIQNLIDTWTGVPKKETKEVNTETNAPETTEKLDDLGMQSQPGNFAKPNIPTRTNANETKSRINTLNAASKRRMGRPKVDTWTNSDTTRGRVNTLASAVNAVPTSKRITFTTSRYENTYRTVKDIMYSGPRRMYKNGTKFHPGGLAVVNDQKGPNYRELIIPKKSSPFILEGRNQLINLERGAKVLKASLTKKMFPHYKDGIGVDERLFENKGDSFLSRDSNVNNYDQRTINNKPTINMKVVWEGKEDIRKTMQEIAWLTEIDERGGLA